ncbi:MAG: 2,4'-dihydroxyacetophenone dioxygenase [Bacillariaceae sp.]|jgi:2,4'-dihydroxyacetophenone dioxygenase
MSTCMRSCVLKRMACRRNYPRLMLLYTVMAAVFIRSIVFDNSSSTTALAFEINPMLTPKVRSTTLPSMKGLRSTSVDDIASSNMRYQLQVPEQTTQAKSEEDKDAYTPYQGEQPKEALSEIFIPQVFSHNPSSIENISLSSSEYEDSLWVPQTDTVSFRPLCFCVSGGYYVNLLRVRGSGLLSRHRHPGPVHGHVLKGKWKYLEHDWVAEAGSYVFEPPGEIHTLVVPEGVDEMVSYMQMLFNRIIIYYILLYSLMLTILHALSTN